MDIDWRDPRSVLEKMGGSVGLWRWAIEEDVLQCSDQLLSMLGIDPEGFAGNFDDFIDRLHPDDQDPVRARIDELIAKNSSFKFRCRMLHADGHHVTALLQGSGLRDNADRPIELFGTVTDLSDETRYYAEWRQTENSFRLMAENVPGAIFRYLLRPDETYDVEYMSPGCFGIWEFSAEEIEEDPSKLWSVVFEEDLPAMEASVMESASNLSQWYHRWRIRTPSGTAKHLEGRGVPVRQSDGSVLWNSLILDISREVAIQEELIAQQRMLGQAQKMESVGRIAGGIAHDFNNLLAIIMGNAELLEDGATKEENQEFTKYIVDACQRGSSLTRQLLSFARRAQLMPDIVNVDAALKEVATLVSRIIPENITVDIVGTAGLWKTELDVSFLENAIMNLCINARDAMPEGGQLTIETSNIRITQDYSDAHEKDIRPGRYVLVAVSDTGVGIPKAEIEKVTEPFYSTKGPDMGSGLGLAMVDGFARQSRGALRIYSEVGEGTTVKLYLPAVEGAGTDAPDRPPVQARRLPEESHGRVLVVEDKEAILNVIAITLKRAGYDVSVAMSGDEAMEVYGRSMQDFDVLLTDIVMPGKLQGPALATEVAAIAPGVRVVFMSGYPNEAAVEGNGIRSTDRFLMKPVMRQDLLRVVSEAVGD